MLKDQLLRHEGLRLRPYICPAGALTIGIGRNLSDKGITEAEAMAMLETDIAGARVDVEFLLDKFGIERWKLSQARQDALANMAFNIGRASLAGFKRMFTAILAEDFDVAAAEMLDSKYARDVGDRAVELSIQLCSGQWHKRRD